MNCESSVDGIRLGYCPDWSAKSRCCWLSDRLLGSNHSERVDNSLARGAMVNTCFALLSG